MRTAYIGLGANLPSQVGLPEATLAAAVERMAALGRITRISSLYSTEPVGYSEQPRFVNAVIALDTDADARQLLEVLQQIELEFGRDRRHSIRNGPRTLDLDILLYGDAVIDEPGLHVPHPRFAERAFALWPLEEIAPDAMDPRSRRTVAELLLKLPVRRGGEAEAAARIESAAWDRMQSKLREAIVP
ncbi:MAG TPA: 2-amino-4-hydroxy-6-hydroxymethyldihydropteridine diphosphokinase [Terracidiphilus sp.]